MPSTRAVLADIIRLGLDPTVPHSNIGGHGHLRAPAPATQDVVAPVVEETEQKVVEPDSVIEVEPVVSEPVVEEPVVVEPQVEVVAQEMTEVENTEQSEPPQEVQSDVSTPEVEVVADTTEASDVAKPSRRRGKKNVEPAN